MQVTVNGELFNIPYSLADIPLQKHIEYYDKYGSDLDKQLEEIQGRTYGEEEELKKQIDLDNHIDNEALAWYSFWTNTDITAFNEINEVLSQYRILRYLLYEDMQKVYELPAEIDWNGETWAIQDYKINPASNTRAIEIFTAKEVLLQMHNLKLSRWHSLIYLCVVFFRKRDEEFTGEMVHEKSERIELMKTLPLQYALQVAFFLNICVHIWSSTSAYLTTREAEIASLN